MGIVVEGNVSEFRFVGRVPEQQVCPVVGSSISQEEVSDHCHMPSPIVQAVHPSAESPEEAQPSLFNDAVEHLVVPVMLLSHLGQSKHIVVHDGFSLQILRL